MAPRMELLSPADGAALPWIPDRIPCGKGLTGPRLQPQTASWGTRQHLLHLRLLLLLRNAMHVPPWAHSSSDSLLSCEELRHRHRGTTRCPL